MTKLKRRVLNKQHTSRAPGDHGMGGLHARNCRTLDGSSGRTLDQLVDGMEGSQRQVEEALERLCPKLADRVESAALPDWLLIFRAELRSRSDLPLILATRRLVGALVRAQAALAAAESIKTWRLDSPIHAWIRQIRARLGPGDDLDSLGRMLASPADLALLRDEELPTRRVRPAANDDTIRTRVMPRIRVAVYREIEPEVQRFLEERAEPITLGGKNLRDDGAAYALTAAYLEAFFPKWGPTTSRSVQTAVRNAGLSKSRRR